VRAGWFSLPVTKEIASEHLLLGSIRETALTNSYPQRNCANKSGCPTTPMSADVPLTRESKRILAHAPKEAQLMGGAATIHSLHLSMRIPARKF